jgi:glycosyltransferase involved in cell wall biosynthesis/tetratricopeptide (TPR) repeat protein
MTTRATCHEARIHEDADRAHQAALAAVRADDREEAIHRLTELLRRHPRHAPALSDLAVLLHRAGRTDEAARLLRAACACDPDRDEAWENLIDLLLLQDRPEDAGCVVRSWLERRPGREAALGRAAQLGIDEAEAGAGRAAWLDTVRRDPGKAGLLEEAIDRLDAAGPVALEPGESVSAVLEIEVPDVAALVDHPLGVEQPALVVLTADDPVGDADAERIDAVGRPFDLGNAFLLARHEDAAARLRRAGLPVHGLAADRARCRDELSRRRVVADPASEEARPTPPPAEVPVHLPFPESAVDLEERAAVLLLLRRHLGTHGTPRILVTGAGEGRLLADLAGSCDAVATEAVAWKIQVARWRLRGVPVPIHEADPLRGVEPHADLGAFDAVVCPRHAQELDRFAREGALRGLASRLNPGGLLVVTAPHREAPVDTTEVPRTRDGLVRDLEAFGFEVLDVIGAGAGLDGDAPRRWVAAARPRDIATTRRPAGARDLLPAPSGPGKPGRPPLPVLGDLTPARAPEIGTKLPPLLWCGAMLSPGGYATYNRNSILWLRRAGVNVGARNHDEPNPGFLASLPIADLLELKAAIRDRVRDGILLVNYQPTLPTGQDVYRQMRWQHPQQRAYVGLTTFETDTMPPHWVASANAMDEIWVPSSFSIDAFARAGVAREKLKAIGFAIDPDLFDPSRGRPAEIPDRRGFVFYSVFQWHGRKGWRDLITAWARAFAPGDDVQLVLKTMRGAKGAPPPEAQIDEHLSDLGLSRERVAPILVIDEAIGDDELRGLYFAADAFVLPTRGEGWGIPYMEAMACGLPTIGTRWSGHLDFMNDENSFLVDVEALRPVDPEMLEFSLEYAGQRYAQPSVEHLVERLREVRDDPVAARRVGARAARDIRERWNPARYVERILGTARSLAARLDGRRRPAPPRASALPAVTVRGSLFESNGSSHDTRTIAGQLARTEVPLELDARYGDERIQAVPEEDAAPLIDRMLAQDVLLDHGHPRRMPVPDPDRRNVARVRWSGDRLPPEWLPRLEERDEVWVPSEHHADLLRSAGLPGDRIRRLPTGVDLRRFRPDVEPLEIPGATGVVFLANLDLSPRRGWDVLVDAFFAEFEPGDDVHLVLNVASTLSRLPGRIRQTIESRARRAARPRWGHDPLPLTILPGTLSAEDLPRLYRAADAYVYPARAGTGGLTVLEAMACGLPVLTTGWGPHTETATGDAAMLVDFDLVPTSLEARREEPELRGQLWAEPRPADLRAKLRRLAEEAPLRSHLGRQGRDRIREGHERDAVGDRILDEVRRLGTSRGSRRAPRPVRVCWRGPCEEVASIALVNDALTRRLQGLYGVAVEHRVEDLDAPVDADVVVSHSWPPAFRRPDGARRHVLILPWEYGRVPTRWVEEIRQGVDEVWVPTHHVFEGLVASGVPADRIQVFPNGVDELVFGPLGPTLDLPTAKTHKILFVGGTIWRKGIDLLVDAYDAAYRPEDDVCLIVKDFGEKGVYRECSGTQQLRARARRKDRPELLLLDQELDDREMAALYRTCDVLVHPYRAEGFAMPVAEAGACGLPVIATEGGATADFHDERTGWLVPSERVPFTTEAPYEAEGWVLRPDPRELLRAMLEVRDNPGEARKRGQRAAERIRDELKWNVIAEAMAARLRGLAR